MTTPDLPPYSPGQLRHVARFLTSAPKWLVLGGPSCGMEAQLAVQMWPGIRILAVEPSGLMIMWQRSHQFPAGGTLLYGALSDAAGEVSFVPCDGPSGGWMADDEVPDAITVSAFTLDDLDATHGPFDDAVLWLDIEGSELKALQGAAALLASGRVLLINVEVCDRTPDATASITALLTAAGYRMADAWNNNSGAHHDEVWTR